MANHIYQGAVETVGCQLLIIETKIDEDNIEIFIFDTIIQECDIFRS
jgi:hypothetical protein